jgi:surfeit locus 1 family protein
MKRLPVIPTILVGLAVAAMIALGVWQLDRKAWKEGLLAEYARNQTLPPIAFPRTPVGDQYLFRRASAFCLKPVSWQREAGRAADGGMGWRQIARCATGAEGPGFSVQMGVSKDPTTSLVWGGGKVSGFISHAPDHSPIIASLFGGGAPKELMLVADTPLGDLAPNQGPDLSSVPNNHLAYAVQWFIFAALAVVIYLLALRGRWRKG